MEILPPATRPRAQFAVFTAYVGAGSLVLGGLAALVVRAVRGCL